MEISIYELYITVHGAFKRKIMRIKLKWPPYRWHGRMADNLSISSKAKCSPTSP